MSRGVAVFLLFTATSCVGPAPHEDYTMAWTALESARSSGAVKYAPGLWFKSDESFRLGQQAYEDRYYDLARRYFKNSRIYAEKAENSTRLKKFQSGDEVN